MWPKLILFNICWVSEADNTNAIGAVVGLELVRSCRIISGDARAVVAALCVGAVPPVSTDVGDVLALVVICGAKDKG